ncbi:hypothetical protein D1871_10350 [Nakamurella silvestris]|nr:hypothetical protein D1871_10350 [Nakamurella silvestris]
MSEELERLWGRVLNWCAVNAPETAARIRPSAGPEAIHQAEATTGHSWPPELKEWFSLHDGDGAQGESTALLPNYGPLSLDDATQIWESFAELMAEQYEASYFDPDARSIQQGEGEPAGREAMMFLPSFIPIGGADPYYLFVDVRPGEQSGCVTAWDHTAADQHGPIWPSLTAMVADLAAALEGGTECNGYLPGVHQGRLGWYLEP